MPTKNETKTDAQLVKAFERAAKAFVKAVHAAQEAGLECSSYKIDEVVTEMFEYGVEFQREFVIKRFKPEIGVTGNEIEDNF
jgi:hypothetical protein